jgi:hypothetical protein
MYYSITAYTRPVCRVKWLYFSVCSFIISIMAFPSAGLPAHDCSHIVPGTEWVYEYSEFYGYMIYRLRVFRILDTADGQFTMFVGDSGHHMIGYFDKDTIICECGGIGEIVCGGSRYPFSTFANDTLGLADIDTGPYPHVRKSYSEFGFELNSMDYRGYKRNIHIDDWNDYDTTIYVIDSIGVIYWRNSWSGEIQNSNRMFKLLEFNNAPINTDTLIHLADAYTSIKSPDGGSKRTPLNRNTDNAVFYDLRGRRVSLSAITGNRIAANAPSGCYVLLSHGKTRPVLVSSAGYSYKGSLLP